MAPMNYLVLARKYRPEKFAEVVGQSHVTTTLTNAFVNDRVHHAFLFCGPRGVGKTTLARLVGKALNCLENNQGAPCGTCEACVEIASGQAVDYQELDGASNRGIDSIRELTEAVRYQPAVLRKKVYVIDEVHMLTNEAFNALLKTLEEPPPHVTFVLATTEPNKLPTTILSRCQRYDFRVVGEEALSSHLAGILEKEKISFEPAALKLIVRESGGSVRDALSLLDQIISFVGQENIEEDQVANVLGVADRTYAKSLAQAIVKGETKAAISLGEAGTERGISEVQIVGALVRFFRDLCLIGEVSAPGDLVEWQGAELDEMKSLLDGEDSVRMRRILERLLRAANDLTETDHPKVVLDLALIDTCTLESLEPISNLLKKLGTPTGGTAPGRGHGAAAAVAVPVTDTSSQNVNVPSASAAPTGKLAGEVAGGGPPNVMGDVGSLASLSPSSSSDSGVAERPMVAQGSTAHVQKDLSWKNVLLTLAEQRKLSLYGFYEQARVLEWNEKVLSVGFAQDLHSLADLANETDNRLAMECFVRDNFGRDVKVTVEKLSEESQKGAPSAAESFHESAQKDRNEKEQEARQHPITKAVMATFGAEIEEVRINGSK